MKSEWESGKWVVREWKKEIMKVWSECESVQWLGKCENGKVGNKWERRKVSEKE
jgi:hypothetical protein